MNHKFKFHTIESAPNESKPILSTINKSFGFLPSLPTAMAESPMALKVFSQTLEAFSKSHFTELEREVIFLTIDVQNECSYCVAFHSTIAERIGMDPQTLDNLRHGISPENRKLGVLSTMTRELIQKKGNVDPTLIESFLNQGYSLENILEILVAWSSQVISNSLNHLVNAPLEPAFKKHEWAPGTKT